MTREIKFREWKNGKYRSWKELGAFHMRVLNDGKGVFEQYTGIKDKNGVEIYEGDIVAGDVVKFYRGLFEPVAYFKSEAMEVIGNVHENPELLEEEV